MRLMTLPILAPASALFSCKGRSMNAKSFALKSLRTLRNEFLTVIEISCLFILGTAFAHATSYAVKAGGGGNYTTIQACANAMSPGDTCTVYAGTYNENVNVSSGSSGSQKTMTVNPGDLVYVESFTIGSYVTVNGFHIQNPSSPTNAPCVTINPNSTYWQITKNNWYACASLSMTNGTNNSHGLIKDNTISYMCSTSSSPNVCYAGTVSGDYILIQDNDMSHLSDGFYLAGAHDYLVGNNFHNMQDSDCGSHSSNCHVDFMQADATVPGGLPSTYLTIEGNTIQNMVATGTGDMHGIGLFQAESCNNECQNGIVRFNTDAHIAHGAIIDDNSGDTTAQAWINVKSYNNSFIDVNHNDASTNGSGTNGYTHGSKGWADLNDLYYYPQSSMPNFNPYATDSTTVNSGNYGHNLVYCTGSCTLFGHVYGSGAFTSDPGNVKADPNFVNYSGGNYNYNSGSPALNSGTSLTTVASGDSGSGNSLVVTDAAYFQDGSRISGLQGDCIAVATVSNHVCITAVNYSTNTLTLSAAVTRSPGDPVWLYSDSTGTVRLKGSAPNIGAGGAQSTASPAAPLSLNGQVIQQ